MLGMKVRDVVSGFEGIATGRVEYINGCKQFLITPRVDKDGKYMEAQWVDQQRVEILDSEPVVKVSDSLAGGPSGGAPHDARLG